MHYLSVIAMFKNESTIIEQWIQHYLLEGVEHFYLIDNGSTDDYEKEIKKYFKKITLIKDNYRQERDTQNVLINKHYLNQVKKESIWVIICDIDEYIYNTSYDKTIKTYLNNVNNCEKFWIPWKLFSASNDPNIIPTSIVYDLTTRKNDIIDKKGFGKSIVKCTNLIQLETHNSSINGITKNLTLSDNLHCNHYKLISEKYFKDIKSKRGGGQSGLTNNYKIDNFYIENKLYQGVIDNSLALKYKHKIKNFNYDNYRKNNKDLVNFDNKKLWIHWIRYGIIENRKV